ncbi:MAG: hypothetical protein WDO13_21700 [Verrucomicrobiota bacterium]
MYVNIDPEGNVSGIFPDSPLSLVIPAGYNVHLFASFDGGWEQAVVIYIDGERYDDQLGSYVLRPSSLVIPKRETGYELTLVAWHKRSDANAALPWVASRGQRVGPVVFAWDDSAEDGDYRDTRIKLVTS